jgi:DNA-directed RNA polymerase subunit H (RpoH/RPB5)
MNKDEFMKTIQYQGHVIVEARDTKDRQRKMRVVAPELRKLPVQTFVVIFDETDTYTRAPEYRTLMESLFKKIDRKKHNVEIITSSRYAPSVFLRKAINTLENPKGSAGMGYVRIFPRLYVSMRNINPLHDNAPKCRILSESEENEVLDTLFIDKKMLPRIFEDDGMPIWYPAEVGDIVEEMHISESVGLEKIYRIVIPTPQIEK